MKNQNNGNLHKYFLSPAKKLKVQEKTEQVLTDEPEVSKSLNSELENTDPCSFSSLKDLSDRTFLMSSSFDYKDERKVNSKYEFLINLKDENGNNIGDLEYDKSTLMIPDEYYDKFTNFEKQFWDIKRKYFDTIVCFKKGKFYELYENDADIGARLFNFKVTDRVSMRMAGFPESSYDHWAGKFLESGYKVARVDQTENMIGKNIREKEHTGKKDKIINRELKEIITSGTIYNALHLSSPLSIFLGAVTITKRYSREDDFVVNVSLILYEASLNRIFYDTFPDDIEHTKLRTVFAQNDVKEIISDVKIKFDTFINIIRPIVGGIYIPFKNVFDNEEEYQCFAYIANYMCSLMRGSFIDSLDIQQMSQNKTKTLSLDRITLRNMEILTNNFDFTENNSLYKNINYCITAFGQRLLKTWLLYPLLDCDKIIKRQNITKYLDKINFLLVREDLRQIGDIERMICKCESYNPTQKDVIVFISNLKLVVQFFANFSTLINSLPDLNTLPGYRKLMELIERFPDISEGINGINTIYNIDDNDILPNEDSDDELSILLKKKDFIKNKLAEYLKKEKLTLGCEVKYKDIGKEIFQMEIPRDIAVPNSYFLVSNTKVSKRYYTNELKSLVNEYIDNDELIFQSKNSLLRRVIKLLMANKVDYYIAANIVAEIDVYFSYSVYSRNQKMTYPIISDKLKITGCRNAIYPNYVESDIYLGENNVLLLTGPNMGGKSTLLRSMCYNIILSQMGLKCHADSFETRIFDNIFTRIGANDNLERGESTFMVELIETVRILKNSTSRSFVIIDELGRGTSVNDGEAIARAVLEYLCGIGCNVFFSTHYHKMANVVTGVFKGYMNFEVEGDDVTFLYKLTEGISNSSYGISVAKMAMVPSKIIARAKYLRDQMDLDYGL